MTSFGDAGLVISGTDANSDASNEQSVQGPLQSLQGLEWKCTWYWVFIATRGAGGVRQRKRHRRCFEPDFVSPPHLCRCLRRATSCWRAVADSRDAACALRRFDPRDATTTVSTNPFQSKNQSAPTSSNNPFDHLAGLADDAWSKAAAAGSSGSAVSSSSSRAITPPRISQPMAAMATAATATQLSPAPAPAPVWDVLANSGTTGGAPQPVLPPQ